MLVWLVMKCGSSFSLLVEMADQRPGARQGCQSSLSKSCVALPQCLEGGGDRGRERVRVREREKDKDKS